MNEAESKVIMAAGQDQGEQLVPAVKYYEGQLRDDEEKLLWWAAFMGYMGGMCAASIGPGALQAIEKITNKNTVRLLHDKLN